VITRDDVMPLLLEACPSFGRVWEAEVKNSDINLNEDGTRLYYLDAGDFARHLLELHEQGQRAELVSAFEAIERLHVEGDEYVRELGTIGFLESLQNNAGHRGLDPEVFHEYFGPETSRWWRGLNAFWHGEIPRVQPVDG
jgi:hypothetical protein